jgi:hypothetical protein
MKKQAMRTIGATLVAAGLFLAVPAFAQGNNDYVASLSQDKIHVIEENIVNALTSDIPGMQADAAQLIRDLKSMRPEQDFNTCIFPLMSIVKNESAEDASRILAAFALDQLESSKGYFAITRTALFTDSPKVKHVCTWLAYERKIGRSGSEEKGMASYEPLEEYDY